MDIISENAEIYLGKVIECHSVDEMINVDLYLLSEGWLTDFIYNYKGEKGLWVEVVAKSA